MMKKSRTMKNLKKKNLNQLQTIPLARKHAKRLLNAKQRTFMIASMSRIRIVKRQPKCVNCNAAINKANVEVELVPIRKHLEPLSRDVDVISIFCSCIVYPCISLRYVYISNFILMESTFSHCVDSECD